MSTKKPYDSTDPKQVKKAQAISKILRNRMRNGILKMTADAEMRFVLSSFLDQAGVFRENFHPVPTQHAYNDGFRNGGLWWLTNLLLYDPLIMSKLQTDQDSPVKVAEHDDTSSNDIIDDGDPGSNI